MNWYECFMVALLVSRETALIMSCTRFQDSFIKDAHTWACIYIHTYVYTYIHTYIHAYIHTYIHTYTHTHTHTHIHTYISKETALIMSCARFRDSKGHTLHTHQRERERARLNRLL